MKAYLLTTGTAFGLLTLAHVWRVLAESPLLARDPWFVLITVLSAALAVYATCFLVGWLIVPGGAGAARELIVAVRELRLRSGS